MPTYDDLISVARSIRRELDRGHLAFKSMDRMELTQRVRAVSGESTTRIKTAMGAELEQALNDQGLRCQPGLAETTTGDRVRIFRAGSAASDLIDAVTYPSPEHDRELAAALAKVKGTWDWNRGSTEGGVDASAPGLLRRVLPREKQLEYVRSLDDPDLATT